MYISGQMFCLFLNIFLSCFYIVAKGEGLVWALVGTLPWHPPFRPNLCPCVCLSLGYLDYECSKQVITSENTCLATTQVPVTTFSMQTGDSHKNTHVGEMPSIKPHSQPQGSCLPLLLHHVSSWETSGSAAPWRSSSYRSVWLALRWSSPAPHHRKYIGNTSQRGYLN